MINRIRNIFIPLLLYLELLLVIITGSGGRIFSVYRLDIPYVFHLLILLPIALVVYHLLRSFGMWRGLFFIVLSTSIPLISEYETLSSHTSYQYTFVGISFFHVPLIIITYWFVFIYIGFSMTEMFLKIFSDSHAIKTDDTLLRIFMDGLIVVSIDLFMDPLQLRNRYWLGQTIFWQWPSHGLYFGIPIMNFVGWFLITIFVTGIFRFANLCFKQPNAIFTNSFLVLPLILYLESYLFFNLVLFQNLSIAIFIAGNMAMSLPVLISLYILKGFSFLDT